MSDFVKLHRKHEHDDKIADALDTARARLETNWQPAAISLGVVVLLVAGIWVYMNQQQEAKSAAQKQFSDAMTLAANGQTPDAIVQMGEIIRINADPRLTANATFTLGSLYFENKNYPDAQKYYSQYLTLGAADDLQRSGALSGLGYAMENQGDFAGAAAKFMENFRSYPAAPLSSDNLTEAVRCYLEAKDLTNARVAYDSLNGRFPNGPFYIKATRLMAEKGAFAVK